MSQTIARFKNERGQPGNTAVKVRYSKHTKNTHTLFDPSVASSSSTSSPGPHSPSLVAFPRTTSEVIANAIAIYDQNRQSYEATNKPFVTTVASIQPISISDEDLDRLLQEPGMEVDSHSAPYSINPNAYAEGGLNTNIGSVLDGAMIYTEENPDTDMNNTTALTSIDDPNYDLTIATQ